MYGSVDSLRFSKKNRDQFYSDPEYMSVKLDEAVRQLGFIVEDGRLVCAMDEDGKIVPTKRLEENDGK